MELSPIVGPILVAGIVGLTGWLWRSHGASAKRDRKLDRVLAIFEGEPADLIGDHPAQMGLVAQVKELRKGQQDIAAQVRYELTPNGGASMKDASRQALASAEAAAAAAEQACRSAERTEALMKRHMANGVEIMEVGLENDARFRAAFESLGVDLGDYRPYPPVDTGD